MQFSPNNGLSRPEVPHDDPAVAAALSAPLLAKCDEALEVVDASSFPASHKLVDVARWYIDRLTEEQQEQLNEAVSTACAQGRALKVGSMCSGTESPIAVMQNLEQALEGKLKVEHSFSCEYDPRKHGGRDSDSMTLHDCGNSGYDKSWTS